MPDRIEYEADLFRRYEARIVAVELKTEALEGFAREYKPIVDDLKKERMIAQAIAAEIVEGRRLSLTKLSALVALCALFVPPIVTATLTYVLTRHMH